MKKEKDNIIGMLPNKNNKKEEKKEETSVGTNFVQLLIWNYIDIFLPYYIQNMYVNY